MYQIQFSIHFPYFLPELSMVSVLARRRSGVSGRTVSLCLERTLFIAIGYHGFALGQNMAIEICLRPWQPRHRRDWCVVQKAVRPGKSAILILPQLLGSSYVHSGY